MVGQLGGVGQEPTEQDTGARRIHASIKDQIARGVYVPGAFLPSTRALAAELGVSRTTVTAAYERLLAEGYLETRQGARAQVAPNLQGAERGYQPRPAMPPAPVRLSRYGQRVAGTPAPQPSRGQLIADFRYGDLSAGDFPTLAWKRALNAALLRRPDRLSYGDPCGSPELRAALQAYLWRARGLRCTVDQIVVVNGSQQGLDLCGRLLLDPGDRAVIEDPCYQLARQSLGACAATLVPVEVDREGMRTDRLAAAGDARLAYVTPSHQYPLGGVMPVGRRQELLAWARRTGAYVIEDDYDGEYRYDIAPIQPLHALDRAEQVIYAGTVSKTLSPSLRLGYLVVPPALCSAFAAAKRLSDRHTPSLEQEALASFIADGTYERHVRRARRRNGQRRATLLAALSATLGSRISVVGTDAGLHVVAWFNDISMRRKAELIGKARAVGLGLYPITPLYDPASLSARPDCAGLVMGYACLAEREIKRGVQLLAAVLDNLPAAAGPQGTET